MEMLSEAVTMKGKMEVVYESLILREPYESRAV